MRKADSVQENEWQRATNVLRDRVESQAKNSASAMRVCEKGKSIVFVMKKCPDVAYA